MKPGSFVSMRARRVLATSSAWGLTLRAAVLAVLAQGCTEPTYEVEASDGSKPIQMPDRASDAGDHARHDARAEPPGAPGADAGSLTSTMVADAASSDDAATMGDAGTSRSLSEGEQRLVGHYAMLRHYLGRSTSGSQLGSFVEETYALVDIAPDATTGELKMRIEQCRMETHVKSLVVASITTAPLFPERFPVRMLDVRVTGDTFDTVGPPHIIGYEVEAEGCSAGAELSRPEKVWLDGESCLCSGSTNPPTEENDCRVLDGDGDTNPGFTVRMTGGGMPPFDRFTRVKEVSRYIAGRIASEAEDRKHSARYQVTREEFAFNCSNSNQCPNWGVERCPDEFNAVFFEPIAPADGCAELLRDMESGKLLDKSTLAIPSSC